MVLKRIGALGVGATLLATGLALLPTSAYASTTDVPEVVDSAVNLSASNVTAVSATISWNPTAFAYDGKPYPNNCVIGVYNNYTDAHEVVNPADKSQYISKAAWSVTIGNASTARRDDEIKLSPGEQSYVKITCLNTNSTTGTTWEQGSDAIVSDDAVPLKPQMYDARLYAKDNISLRVGVKLAGTEHADIVQVRFYTKGARTATRTITPDHALANGEDYTANVTSLTNGSYSFSARIHNKMGWGSWSGVSRSVSVTQHAAKSSTGPALSLSAATVAKGKATIKWQSKPVTKTAVIIKQGARNVYKHTYKSGVRAFSHAIPAGVSLVTITAYLKSGQKISLSFVVKR